MNKSRFTVGVGGVAVVAAGSFAVAASAGPELPPPREAAFDSVSACDADEEVLNAIAELSVQSDTDLASNPTQALTQFKNTLYPGLSVDGVDILVEQRDLVRYSFESSRGTELIVDVVATEGRFGVAGWIGCHSFLAKARP